MTGIELLGASRKHAPGAKLLLLTAYADTDVAIRAINEIGLDYYLLKPWDPPEDRLYPSSTTCSRTGTGPTRCGPSEVRIVGHRWSARSHEIKTFLARNHVPYGWFDVERDDEAAAAGRPRRRPGRRAAARLVPDGETAARASAFDVAGTLGLTPAPSSRSTTCASSGPVRPVWPRRCTQRPRGCGPCWSSARRRAARRARAPRSRTTSASPAGSAAPTWRTGGRPGAPIRGGDGDRAGCRRLRGARPGPRGAADGSAARSRRGRLISPLASPTAGCGRRAGRLAGRGVFYGATPPRPASARARTSISSVPPTRPARRP